MPTVAPSTAFTWAPVETGVTGLVGTLKVGVYQDDTAVVPLTAAGVNEILATGVYEATLTSPSTAGTYVLVASLDGTLDPDQLVTDLLVVSWTVLAGGGAGPAYASTDELFRLLRIDSPTVDQTAAAERALSAAAEEINAFLGYTATDPAPDPPPALVVTVNLERAAEHWRFLPFGVLTSGPDTVPVLTARNSWYRHGQKLLPLKQAWGVG